MSNLIELPILPDPADIRNTTQVFRAIADFCEAREPLSAQAYSLQRERNLMLTKLFDVLLEHAPALAEIGALEPIQSIISDMTDVEMETMQVLVEMNGEMVKMSSRLGELIRERRT